MEKKKRKLKMRNKKNTKEEKNMKKNKSRFFFKIHQNPNGG
jgi:hypothetical protein